MEILEEIIDTPTKIFIEGGNNIDRIGGSSMVIFHQDEIGKVTRVMYDCGALFAPDRVNADSFVADVLKYLTVDETSLKTAFPTYSQAEINAIREKYKQHNIGSKKLDAMFVTHMHEDHIGGLLNLLRAGVKFPKIYASKPTAGMIVRLCQSSGIANIPDVVAIEPYTTTKINNNFEVSALPVSHSTAGAYAFYTKTNFAGTETGIINMGDYNIEKSPIGEGFDMQKFSEFLHDKPINNILVDSTSATLGSMISENPVTHDESVQNICEICRDYPNKMIATPIISRSVENLYNFLEAAKKSDKVVFLDGYTLKIVFDELKNQNLMDAYKNTVFGFDNVTTADAQNYLAHTPGNRRMVIFSGAFAEGETFSDQNKENKKISGFVKFVNGSHKDFLPEMLKDTVVVAAQRAIPVGNVPEKQRVMYRKATSKGAIIVQTQADEHSSFGPYKMFRLQRSGHANGAETAEIFKICLRSRSNKDECIFVSPIHGDSKQLIETSKIAGKEGLKTYIPINGDILYISPDYIQAKKKNTPNGENLWLGFTEIANEEGQTTSYEMAEWKENVKSNGKIAYTKGNTIAIIPAKSEQSQVKNNKNYNTVSDDKPRTYRTKGGR